MPAWRIQKVSDEGSSSPYIARLWLGIRELHDHVLTHRFGGQDLDQHRRDFDEYYGPVLDSLNSARDSARIIEKLVKEHHQKVLQGTIVRFQRNAFEISESVDNALNTQFSIFLNGSHRALKGTQACCGFFGVEIGFLFQKDKNFDQGITEIRRRGEDRLADFLATVRTHWSAKLIELRISLEHSGWGLPKVQYPLKEGRNVGMIEPEVGGKAVSVYARETVNSLASFLENIIVYAFQVALKPDLGILEIPEASRKKDFPKRFDLWHTVLGKPEWNLYYCEDDFL